MLRAARDARDAARRPLPVYQSAVAYEPQSRGLKRAAEDHTLHTACTKRQRTDAHSVSYRGRGGAPDVATMRGAGIIRSMMEYHQMLVDSDTSPTPAQVMMQSSVLRALAPIIFAADWKVHGRAIKEYMGIQPGRDLPIWVFQCPRRFGKTLSSAQIAAMILMSFEGITMCVISTGQRIAEAFVGEVQTVLNNLVSRGTGRRCKIACAATGISVTFTDEKGVEYTNELISRPAVVDTIRGTTAQFFFADEANFMDIDIFFKVIFPLLRVMGTVLLCVSSPNSSSTGPSATLWNAKFRDGTSVVNRIDVTVVCPKCKERGVSDCPHNQSVVPPWHNQGVNEMIEALYKTAQGAYRQEILGLTDGESIDAFKPEMFDPLVDPLRRSVFPPCIRVVMFSFDPSGGSKLSDDAGAAVYLDEATGKFVVSRLVLLSGSSSARRTRNGPQHCYLGKHQHHKRVELQVPRCGRQDRVKVSRRHLSQVSHRCTPRVRAEPVGNAGVVHDCPPHERKHGHGSGPGHHDALLVHAVSKAVHELAVCFRNHLGPVRQRHLARVQVRKAQTWPSAQYVKYVWDGIRWLLTRGRGPRAHRHWVSTTAMPKVRTLTIKKVWRAALWREGAS